MASFAQLNRNAERGIAGTMGVVLAVSGAPAGAILYLPAERTGLLRFASSTGTPPTPDAEAE